MSKDERKELFYYFGLVSQVGLTVVFSILGGLVLGIFLDRKVGIFPIFTIIFTLIGAGGGFYSVWRQISSKGKE
jgi:F0F1-type ATP synthase assembly protein I